MHMAFQKKTRVVDGRARLFTTTIKKLLKMARGRNVSIAVVVEDMVEAKDNI